MLLNVYAIGSIHNGPLNSFIKCARVRNGTEHFLYETHTMKPIKLNVLPVGLFLHLHVKPEYKLHILPQNESEKKY